MNRPTRFEIGHGTRLDPVPARASRDGTRIVCGSSTCGGVLLNVRIPAREEVAYAEYRLEFKPASGLMRFSETIIDGRPAGQYRRVGHAQRKYRSDQSLVTSPFAPTSEVEAANHRLDSGSNLTPARKHKLGNEFTHQALAPDAAISIPCPNCSRPNIVSTETRSDAWAKLSPRLPDFWAKDAAEREEALDLLIQGIDTP